MDIKKYTKEERRRMTAAIPKCKCGNSISRQRIDSGIDHCPACDPRHDSDEYKFYIEVLDQFISEEGSDQEKEAWENIKDAI